MLKIIIDLLPLFSFVLTYMATRDLYWVAAATIAASLIQILILRFQGEISFFQKLNIALLFLGGALTLATNNPYFIQIKPTFLYWIFSFIILYFRYSKDRPYIKDIAGHLNLSREAVLQAHWWYAIAFFLLGILNLIIAFCFSQATWVYFKLIFPVLFLSLVTFLYLFYYYKRT